MAKIISEIFVCADCDAQFPKWSGKCPECGHWGSLEKSQAVNLKTPTSPGQGLTEALPGQVLSFDQIKIENFKRTKTGLEEFDRVLGGGLVTGSLVLLGGEPGIGKSTLVLQICQALPGKILYVSGEESGQQIKTRVDRLGVQTKNLIFLGETNIETIAATILEHKPQLAIIDSIQTVYSLEAPSGAGSINQVRICTTKLLNVAKKNNITILIIGHVTKFGEVAGPKTLEHLVDSVLYLEGDPYHAFRILRGAKNRFGSTSEVGIFEMQGKGLSEVKDPAAIFLTEQASPTGSMIAPVLEGSRIFLLEVQALVNTTTFGYPQRKTDGFDLNRLQLLVATLSRRLGLKLANQDIYLNLVGGLKVSEPAIDLPVCLAIISAIKDKPWPVGLIALGEVGLGGEIRPVAAAQKRIDEAEKLGFKAVIMPQSKEKVSSKLKIYQVKNLAAALKILE
ncbi:MAG: DNA repair protein RadA [Candidatus Buchananbacteria bacterium]